MVTTCRLASPQLTVLLSQGVIGGISLSFSTRMCENFGSGVSESPLERGAAAGVADLLADRGDAELGYCWSSPRLTGLGAAGSGGRGGVGCWEREVGKGSAVGA